MKTQRNRTGAARWRGFSLLEMMAAVAIIMIVIGVAVQSMIMMQTRSFAETSKVDTMQETRDFVDQMVRDIHDVGYPPPNITGATSCVNNANAACGVILFSPTQIKYEGDLDGSGTVYQVWLQLLVPASGHCPCILQRGAITKAQALANQSPTYFTEVNGVLNSGDGTNNNGSGASTYGVSLPGSGDYSSYTTSDVFDAYDTNGNVWTSSSSTYNCNTVTTCATIRSLQITVNVAPSFMDQTTQMFQVLSITSKARITNPQTS